MSPLSSVSVLVRVFIAVVLLKQLGEEKVFTFISLFIMEGSQGRNANRAGTWRWKLMQRLWSSAAYWLLLMACSVLEPKTASPGVPPPTKDWALPVNH